MDLRREAALLTAELVVVLVCASAALPIPAQVPLLVMALISYGIRGLTWTERMRSERLFWLIGAITGASALGLGLVVFGPVLEARTGGLVGWTAHAVVRGKLEVLLTFALIVAAFAAGTEVLMRGWILERIREQAPGRTGLLITVAVTAAIEAALLGGPGWSWVGAALISVAMSGLYLASGRSLVAPIVARVTFEVGVVVLEGLKLVN